VFANTFSLGSVSLNTKEGNPVRSEYFWEIPELSSPWNTTNCPRYRNFSRCTRADPQPVGWSIILDFHPYGE